MRLKRLLIVNSVLFINLAFWGSIAAGKSSSQSKSLSVSASFDLYLNAKSSEVLLSLNFDGKISDTISADVKPSSTLNLQCQVSGVFHLVESQKNHKNAKTKMIFNCQDNNQKKWLSQIGFFMIPLKNEADFSRTIYLSDQYPEVILKIKSITL